MYTCLLAVHLPNACMIDLFILVCSMGVIPAKKAMKGR
jgi:hypothetical protein